VLILLSACSAKPQDNTAPKEQIGTVLFEVDAKNAVNYGAEGLFADGAFYPAQSIPLCGGDSVMAILLRALPDQAEIRGGYVAGICGLRERDCGAASGWYYYVNGDAPLMSCAKYYPLDGDTIRLLYTVTRGDIPY
jgi:hypothetical protein